MPELAQWRERSTVIIDIGMGAQFKWCVDRQLLITANQLIQVWSLAEEAVRCVMSVEAFMRCTAASCSPGPAVGLSVERARCA